jgi:ligand-binding sensor domain-containing protein
MAKEPLLQNPKIKYLIIHLGYDLSKDKNGTLWIATYAALFSYDDKN